MTTQIVVIQREQGHTQNTDDYLDYGGASQVAASALKAVVDAKDTDGTLAANSDSKYATQKAVKTYVDTTAALYIPLTYKDTDGTLAANSDSKFATQKATKTYVGTQIAALTAPLPLSYLDTDGTLAANSDTKVASQKATKTAVDTVAKRAVDIVCVDYTTNCAVSDGVGYFRVPDILNGMNLSTVGAHVIVTGTTGTMSIMIRNVTDGVDMLTTWITVDSGEYDSITAATPYVIDTSNDDVATGDLIAVDIDAVHTTPAKGLIVSLTFAKA